MIRDFSKDELEAAESGQDTELTLGGGTLLRSRLRASGSLHDLLQHRVLCWPSHLADCSNELLAVFGLKDHSPFQPGQAPSPEQPGSSRRGRRRLQRRMSPPILLEASRPPIEAQAAVAAGNPGASQPQVKPSLDAQGHPALVPQAAGAQPSSALQVQPAMTQVQGWMVQIAAVSHPEDAEVLVNALRKRGYAVIARREVGDNLIHVQTGPFANRNDANAMRQKLLNDGYNAIVQ